VTLRLAVLSVLAAVCAAAIWALARPAVAQPRAIRLSLRRGALAVAAPSVTATANGSKTVLLIVTDARGSGAGWTLRVIAARPVTVTSVSTKCSARSTCTLPRATGLGPAPRVLRSLAGSGMGVVRLTVTIARLARGTPNTPVTFAVR
jgi:hypothetical protein